jgi:proline dehydrogenase
VEDRYRKLLETISTKHGIDIDTLERRVSSRRAKVFGLISRRMAARSIAFSLGIEPFLARGARHVCGLRVSDALAAAQAEAKAGNLSTFGYWPQPSDTPGDIAAHYLEAIDTIAEAKLDSSISVKVDRLDYDRNALIPVFRHAMSRKVCVHFDFQGPDTDRTHALMEEALDMGVDVAATLPSRWARSIKDAERLIELRVPFRIVKGQSKDPDNPGISPRRSFIDLATQVAGRAAHVGVATHDRRTAEPALDILLAAGTPCSLEQLRSLPALDFLATRRGVNVRAYIAYGRFGLPYAIGEVMRRPEIIWWVMRDVFMRPVACRGERSEGA